ncbi:reverse transcriptase domain-containing protein [Tanacetum coccineum]
MEESDEEKTAFHTSQGVYCYTKMPFGLKNDGATYQRLVDKAFDSQVGRNIEVYVDDLVIKSHTEAEMLRDIDETFCTLRKINMKLNPKKCTFGAVEGMFLGYMISPEGIQPIKQAFKQLKQHLLELPLLVAPKPKEELIVYMSTTHGAINAVLMTERDMGSTSTSVKGQILADFLIKKQDKSPPDTSVVETQQEPWTLFMDGSSFVDGSGAGLILTSPEGTEFTYELRFQFTASNNEAEYEALIACLRIAARMGVRNVHVSVDSKLVANQVPGAYVAKEENMIKYLEKVKSLEKEVTTVVEENGPTWMTPIIEYLDEGTLLDVKKEASKLHIKARQYELLEGIIYRRSFLKLWLRTTVRGSQSHAAGILLANHAPGRTRDDTYMQRLSNTLSCAKKPPTAANPNHGPVAILQVGN